MMKSVVAYTALFGIGGVATVYAKIKYFPPLDQEGAYEGAEVRKKIRETYDLFAKNYVWIHLWGLILAGGVAAHRKIDLSHYMSCVNILGAIGCFVYPSPLHDRRENNTQHKDSSGPPLHPVLVYIPYCIATHSESIGTVFVPDGEFPEELRSQGLSPATPEQIERLQRKREAQKLNEDVDRVS